MAAPRIDPRDITRDRHPRSLKDVMTAPPMTGEQHKAIQERRVAARHSVEDRQMERELLK